MNPHTTTKWHTRFKCTECGYHERLSHSDLYFAPNLCPGCGATGTLRKARMRKNYVETETNLLYPSTWWGQKVEWQERE
jgi:predicted RNA-binding Zn-ribbon protein involved in translation (DUF1610 family)